MQRLTQGKVRPVEIHFKYSCPEDTTEYKRIFGCPLTFNEPRNEFVLRRKDLDYPIFLANPQLLNKLEQFAQESLERLYPPDTWSDKVVSLIHKNMVQGEKPVLGVVASKLGFSSRQLQNKLRDEGITYQALLDEVRKELAFKYLGETQETVCDIAFLLGFSEQSAFDHAFKRWTSCKPGEYRKLSVPSG